MSEIREAAAAVRETFDTPYGLVPKRITTDGVDIFVEHGLGDLRRARDGQPPSRRSWRSTFATCVGGGRRLPEVGCEPVLESAVPELVGGAGVAQESGGAGPGALVDTLVILPLANGGARFRPERVQIAFKARTAPQPSEQARET